MKKIINIFPLLGLTLVFAACDYNELNFPGYNDGVTPTNIFAYEDSLVSTDYADISKLGLAVAVDAADTIAAKSIATNKYFTDDAPSYKYIPLWLAKKYLYGDRKSSVMVTSFQYITDEGETQYVHEKYILDSIWARYDAEILSATMETVDDFNKFTIYSTEGDQVWAWASYKYAKMTGYVSSVFYVNDDWLITPALNLSKRVRATLTFDHVFRYGNNDTIQTTVWATDNYTPGTQPNTSQWKQYTFNFANTGTWTFSNSGDIVLDEFAGKEKVYVAFHYCSFGTSPTTPTWEIKNILVLEPDEE